MIRTLRHARWLAPLLLLAGCGGGGGGYGSSGGTPPPPAANSMPLTVDSGPLAATSPTANTLYASVTICTPNSTSACQTIDHIQVDTASYGLRLIGSTLNGAATPTPVTDPATGNPLFECLQFADGYTWGSVARVDIRLGGRTISSVPIQVLADAPSGISAPVECVSGPSENTVGKFGANGLLGVGPFGQDCPACISTAVVKAYYLCPGNTCSNAKVSLANQVQNPLPLLASDNNGLVIQMPAVGSPGAATATGALYFGVNTQSNNMLGAASWITLNGGGEFTTVYAGSVLAQSFVDTGSNGYFFNKAASDTVLVTCTVNKWAYCPVQLTPETGTIQDPNNGAQRPVNFMVDNADNLFKNNYSAFPNLAGPNSAANAPSNSFDWGLPFFFGRPVFILFEGKTVGTTTGPALAF